MIETQGNAAGIKACLREARAPALSGAQDELVSRPLTRTSA